MPRISSTSSYLSRPSKFCNLPVAQLLEASPKKIGPGTEKTTLLAANPTSDKSKTYHLFFHSWKSFANDIFSDLSIHRLIGSRQRSEAAIVSSSDNQV